MADPATHPDDADLLRRYARHRDDAAFARVVGRHARAVRHVAYRHTRDRTAAEDVAQAAFLVMARRPTAAMRSARRKRSALPWLAKVCRYAAGNWRRSETRRLRRERLSARHDVTADPVAAHDLADAVRSALSCLPRRDRRLVELRHVSQLSWSEIARQTGTTAEAARKATARATAALRHVLERRGITAGVAAVVAGLHALARPVAAAPLAPVTAASLASQVLLYLHMKLIATSAVAVAALLGVAAVALALAPDDPPATQPATPTARPLVVDLGGGGTLEVLYVAEHQPGGRVWNPDGSPSDRERLFGDDVVEGEGLLEVAFRQVSPAGMPYFSYIIDSQQGVDAVKNWRWSGPEESRASRRPLRQQGYELVVLQPAAEAQSFSLDTFAPLGGWTVLHRWNNIGMSGNLDADAVRARGVATPAVGGTFGQDLQADDGSPMTRTHWFIADADKWQLDTRARLTDGTLADMSETSWSGDGGNLVGQSNLAGHHRDVVEFFELLGRPTGKVSLTGLAAAPDVRSEPAAAIGEVTERPEKAWPEGGPPKLAEAIDIKADFPLNYFIAQVQRETGVYIGIDDYLLRGAGIDAYNGPKVGLTAPAGANLGEALDRAVGAADERLAAVWSSGRFLITLDPDLTPPPPAPPGSDD